MTASALPRIAVTMGDPAGVGPEIALKALVEPEAHQRSRPVVFGSVAAIEREASRLGLDVEVASDPELDRDDGSPARVLVHPTSDAALPPYGVVSPEGGEAAVAAVRAASDFALDGRIAAIATGPLNKESMRRAGYPYDGHTEMLAAFAGADQVSMLLIGPRLRVAHMTTHIPLERVPERITEERLVSVVGIAERTLRRLGIAEPRIAVAGLNPHAGENGLFGDQEVRVLTPAIARMQEEGRRVVGPVPGDTVFIAARRGDFDLVVVMYHDQGHIPIKLLDMDEAVNVTGGLPIIRTSVDHGTAFDIAGQGIARPDSMRAALRVATELAAGALEERGPSPVNAER